VFSFDIILGPALELATRLDVDYKMSFSKINQPASYKLPCREQLLMFLHNDPCQ